MREEICNATISPMNTYRQWLAGAVPETNPNDDRPGDQRAETAVPGEMRPRSRSRRRTFPWSYRAIPIRSRCSPPSRRRRKPADTAHRRQWRRQSRIPAELSGLGQALITAAANLFGVPGKLWMRNTFGFAVLEKPDGATSWTATLHDVDGKAIAQCSLDRSNASENR